MSNKKNVETNYCNSSVLKNNQTRISLHTVNGFGQHQLKMVAAYIPVSTKDVTSPTLKIPYIWLSAIYMNINNIPFYIYLQNCIYPYTFYCKHYTVYKLMAQ